VILFDNVPRKAGFVDRIVVYNIPSNPAAPAVLNKTIKYWVCICISMVL